jgi:hypothetical protein
MLLSEEDEKLIRSYFLGDLSEEEGRRLEERVFTDSDFKNHVLIVEDELVEDYAAQILPVGEREKFERHFLTTSRHQEKLKIVNALKARARLARPAASPQPVTPGRAPFGWLRLPPLSGLGRAASISLYAVLLLALSFGLWYAYRELRSPSEEARNLEKINAEIAALNRNGPIMEAGRPDVLPVSLTSGLVRGDDEQAKLILPNNDLIVQFRLRISIETEFPRYDVSLLNSDAGEVFAYDGLTTGAVSLSPEGHRQVLLDVPARALPPGDYVLKLKGISNSNQEQIIGDYSFRVVRR